MSLISSSIQNSSVIALQVRLASTRLPFKALLPALDKDTLELKPNIEIVLSNLLQCNHKIILCTCDDDPASKFVWDHISHKYNLLPAFYGDCINVMLRYNQLSQYLGEEVSILRFCGDSPLISPQTIHTFFDLVDNSILQSSISKIFTTRGSLFAKKGANIDLLMPDLFKSTEAKSIILSNNNDQGLLHLLNSPAIHSEIVDPFNETSNLQSLAIDTVADYSRYLTSSFAFSTK